MAWAWPGEIKNKADIGLPISIRAFLITYP